MPKLPQLNTQVRESVGQVATIQSAGGPSTQDQATNQILKTAFAEGANLYKQEKDYANQIAVMEADKKLSALETNLLYNPQTGAMNTKGKSSFDAVQNTDSAFQTGISDIENSLTNDEQKIAFKKLSYGRQADVSRQLNRHVSVEKQRYEIQETEAYIQTERAAVVQNPFDLERIDQALTRQTMAIKALSERNGLPAEVTQQSLNEVYSKTHSAVINQMLAQGSDRAADEYFKTNQHQITGDDKTRLTKDLEMGTLAGESQRRASDLFTSSKDYGTALAEARKIEEPKLQDATIQRIKELQNQKDEVERDRKEKMNVGFADMIDAGQDPRGKPGWADLTTSERTNLDNYYRHRMAGSEPKTQWDSYYDLKNLGGNPNTRDQFMKIDLFASYRGKLADAEFKEIVNLQSGLRNGDGATKSALDGYMSDSAVVNDALESMGIDTGSRASDREKQKAAAFSRLVDEQVIQLKATGKKVTNDDIRSITDNLMVEVVTNKGFIWDTKKRAYELSAEDVIENDISVKDIPKAEIMKIQDYLKRNGKPDSDTAIVDLYMRKIKMMRNK